MLNFVEKFNKISFCVAMLQIMNNFRRFRASEKHPRLSLSDGIFSSNWWRWVERKT